MVHVVVGNQNSINAGYVSSMLSQPPLGLASTDPGVEEQLDTACFHVDAVAVAAGLEGDDVHGHIVLVVGQGR